MFQHLHLLKKRSILEISNMYILQMSIEYATKDTCIYMMKLLIEIVNEIWLTTRVVE